jgi:hypothetical protein
MAEGADGNAKSWRAKAEEARVRAAGMRDAAAKKIMLEVANGYEQLAAHAERREAEMKLRRSN